MAVLKVKTKAKPLPSTGTVRPPAKDLDVADLDLRGDSGQVAHLKRATTEVTLTMTLDGASTLEMKVRDPHRTLLHSALVRTHSQLVLDGVEYTLVKVARDGNELTLTFEETAINVLRQYSKPRKANRKNTTRAQFIKGLVDEPTRVSIPFRCPELDERQPQLKPDLKDGGGGDSSSRRRLLVVGGRAADDGSSSGPSAAALASLTVKHVRANAEQLKYGALIVAMTIKRGGDRVSVAGAIATSIQESGLMNLGGGDRDSAGLFQQRPSVGAWGSYADVTNPEHAINAFLDRYLGYRNQGHSWIDASNLTQRSKYPQAPAPWYGEGKNFYNVFHRSGGSTSPLSLGAGADTGTTTTSHTVTRVEPYEFSRGSADARETSWQCARRLADEVKWRFFCRAGVVWYVSDNWLIGRSPVARLTEHSAGVVDLSWDWETRRPATEATLTVLTRRYAIFPGDVIEIQKEGTANGLWLVSEVDRTLGTQQATINLVRKQATLPEPAPSTTTKTITVKSPTAGVADMPRATSGSGALNGASTSGVPLPVARAYLAANKISDKNYPYVWGGGHSVAGQPSGGGYDCSGSVSAALAQAGGMGLTYGGAPMVSGSFESWGEAGPGRYFTVYCSSDHVWIRWNGVGNAWRFDTSPWNSGPLGPHQRVGPRSTDTFVARHWPGY